MQRTSMIKVCIFHKSLKRQSQILKRMNYANFFYVSDQIDKNDLHNHMRTNFWMIKMLKGGDNQGFIYLSEY